MNCDGSLGVNSPIKSDARSLDPLGNEHRIRNMLRPGMGAVYYLKQRLMLDPTVEHQELSTALEMFVLTV